MLRAGGAPGLLALGPHVPDLVGLLEDGRGSEAVDHRIPELEATLRMTSICGLGQVALGPVISVLGIDRGGAEAREHPKNREDTET